MPFKYTLDKMSWDGWYEGRKRPHRHIAIVISYIPDSAETTVLLIDSSKIYEPGLAHITYLYRGRDFPRDRILTADNIPVAASGVAQPGDFVVGNKFVVEAEKPPVVLRHCQDPKEVTFGHRQGDGYQLQPPDMPYEDEGVPEWPAGYDPDIALIEYMEQRKQLPKGSAAAARAEIAARACESNGEGVQDGGNHENTAASEDIFGSSEAAAAAGAGAGEPADTR